ARRDRLFAVILRAGCGSASANGPAPAPIVVESTPTGSVTAVADRLPPDQTAALVRLAAQSGPIDPTAAHDHGPVTLVSTLPPEEQERFDEQITAAVDAATRFATTEQAAAAGYVQSSTQLPGIGTHWVKWSLVEK